MLPLWIIDITSKSDRRDEFVRLAGQIDHVSILDKYKSEAQSPTDVADAGSVASQTFEAHENSENNVGQNPLSNEEDSDMESGDSASTTQKTLYELQDEEARKEAAKNAQIKGCYWYYSQFDEKAVFNDDFPDDLQKSLEEFLEFHVQDRASKGEESLSQEEVDTFNDAMMVYRFQEEIVKEAVNYVATLRKSNVKPYQPINIVVLGDATEDFTLRVFASIAGLLRKEKGRFLPAHIHQGMNVYGALYIPCDVNSKKVEERVKILHLLDEIEVQHRLTVTRGYDYMMLYQNVQNRTECTYPMLDGPQQAQYLLQCLVHMFLACDINHPLISGTSSDETFYFSMGAASVYFDMKMEDKKEIEDVARNILENFKRDGDNETYNSDEILLDKSLYEASIFIKNIRVHDIELGDEELPEFSPHPITDFCHRYLKPLYYNYALKFFPAKLLRKILSKIEDSTHEMLEKISSNSVAAYKTAAMSLRPAIIRRIAKVTENDGGLCHIEYLLKNFQEYLSKAKEDIKEEINKEFWYKLMYVNPLVPKKQLGFFEDYHEAYRADIHSKTGGATCASMREDAIKKLKTVLSREKTMLSTLGRMFFMGIVCVLCCLPILGATVLDGKNSNYLPWGIAAFLTPVLWQFISYLLYIRKRNKCIRVLNAYYTHDAYARVSNRIEFEGCEFYDKLIQLAQEYLNRCELIRKEIRIEENTGKNHMVLPRTMFNQPLNGGTFDGEEIIPVKEIEGCRIKINYQPRVVKDLKRSHYFMLINRFKDEFAHLFDNVAIDEGHTRRYDSKKGEMVFVGKDELEQERKMKWAENTKKFFDGMYKGIAEDMVPREFPTVGQKLNQYKLKIDRYTMLKPLMAIAAANGEIIADSDTEYADIKVNCHIDDLSAPYLPLFTTRVQVAKYDEIYKKYIFVTRWRCFDHFSYNRILPTEDFDLSEREKVNYEAQKKAKERETRKKEQIARGECALEDKAETESTPYIPSPSSLLLWAVSHDDNSGEWLKLFSPEHFGLAYRDREIYQEILNQND